MKKLNCWESKKCGREPGGEKARDLGACPSATLEKANGINHGKNAGRSCWVVAGTLCGGKTQGEFAMKLKNCLQCEFYDLVVKEEGVKFSNAREILMILKS